MGKSYGHVTIEERCEIARLQAKRRSVRQIAADLDRSPSTVARELKRNGSRRGEYKAVYADQQAHARRWRGSRMERDSTLRTRVLSHLSQAGLLSRLPVGLSWRPDGWSSPTRASTGLSMVSWPERRIIRGVTTCPERSRDEAGEAAKGAVLPPSWLCGGRLPSARRAPLTAALPATGRRT